MRVCQHNGCNKKLRIAEGVTCKCGLLFCNVHRYTDKHYCTIDYKEIEKVKLMRNNITVVADKIKKI